MDMKTLICSLLEETAPNMPARFRRLCSKGYMFKTTQHLPACENQQPVFKTIRSGRPERHCRVLTYQVFGNGADGNLIIGGNVLLLQHSLRQVCIPDLLAARERVTRRAREASHQEGQLAHIISYGCHQFSRAQAQTRKQTQEETSCFQDLKEQIWSTS